jgi:hypothetical protein
VETSPKVGFFKPDGQELMNGIVLLQGRKMPEDES